MLFRFMWLTIILFSFAGYAAGQDTKGKSSGTDAVSQPTLEEATAWLMQTISKSAGYSKRQADMYSENIYEEVGFDTCTMRFADVSEAENGYGKLMRRVFKNSFLLADIDPGRIVVEKKIYNYLVKIPTRNDEKKIKAEMFTDSLGKTSSKSSLNNVSSILFTDKALAERVARVLRYVASLCAPQK
jgi:hypothetical protein